MLCGIMSAQMHFGMDKAELHMGQTGWVWACSIDVFCFADGLGAQTPPAAGWGSAFLQVRPCLCLSYKQLPSICIVFCQMLQAMQRAAR